MMTIIIESIHNLLAFLRPSHTLQTVHLDTELDLGKLIDQDIFMSTNLARKTQLIIILLGSIIYDWVCFLANKNLNPASEFWAQL